MIGNINMITIAGAADTYSFNTHRFHYWEFIVWKYELEIGVVVI